MPSTKPRIWTYVDPEIHAKLELLAKRPGQNASSIVNHALTLYFAGHLEKENNAAIIRRLDRMTRQTEALKRNQIISAEALALYVRYFLTVIPPVPDKDKKAASAQGAARFERYVESLQTVLADGEQVLFSALEDIMTDDSAYFSADELMKLHEPVPEKEVAHA